MSARRPKASEVWEVPLTGGLLRVRAFPGAETCVQLELMMEEPAAEGATRLFSDSSIVLTAAQWRMLCDLRNVIKFARAKRNTP